MPLLRRFLLSVICLGNLLAATAVDHPLYFERRSPGLFETRDAGRTVAIHTDGVTLDGVSLHFVEASRRARLEGVGPAAPSTYIIGGETHSFRQFPRTQIRGIYPGIDIAFYGTPGHLEYDLDLAPGAAGDRIRIAVTGARKLRLDDDGNLIVETASGELRQLAPHVFQNGHPVPAHYVLLSHNEIGFRLGKHDRSKPLTIDPVLVYQKYFGGSANELGGPVATDAQGNVYVTGRTNSIDFPTTKGSKAAFQPPLLAYSDAGQKVTRIPVETETSVTAISGTTDGKVLYVATPDGIFISGNRGASWMQAIPLVPAAGPGPPGTVNAISVDQIDPSRAWIATSAGLFQMNTAGQLGGEDDFGMAIGGAGHVNANSVQIDAVDHLTIYATTASPNFLYKTSDAGANWHQLFPAYPGEPAPQQFSGTNITFTLSADGSDLYVIDANGVLLKSTDGGAAWQHLADQLYGAKSITIDPKNPSSIYVVDNFGLAKSTDGGETFALISPHLQNGDFVQCFAIDGSGALYFSSYIQFDVSTDSGKTWKPLAAPNPHVLVSLGGQVLEGASSSTIPFVTKWSPDGSRLLYSTFFGGSNGDSINAISIDSQGEAIIAGNASSPDFPATKTISANSQNPYAGFVAKLSTDGSKAIYATLLGGSQGVYVRALAIDSSGAPYITGNTSSPEFPTTSTAFQPKLPTAMCQRAGIAPFQQSGNLETNAFVTKLSPDSGSLIYSTFLTAACGSLGQGIALDAAGEAVVAGETTSPDFPVSANAYQSNFPGGPAATVDFPNPVSFGFVSKLSAAGDKLIASSFIGGGFMTQAEALTLDGAGNAYLTGSTSGITPGATPGAYQTQLDASCVVLGIGPTPPSAPMNAFLLKLDPAFTQAQFLTYLGTGCYTGASSIVLQTSGEIWIAGQPVSGFPLVAPYALTGSSFVSKFNADASQLLFSSYSDGQYLAEDTTGAIYVSGSGQAPTGPQKNSTNTSSVSLVKIDPDGTPPVIINSIGPATTYQKVSNATSPYTNAVAPGELIEISGAHLGPSDTVMAQLDATNHLPFVVSGTSVMFNDYVAPIISVQDGLIVCFAPFEISGITDVTVTANGQKSTPVRVAVYPTAPYILAVVNQDGTPNSADHPAPQGSVLAIYVTGLGITSPLSQDGSVSYPPLATPAVPVIASIGQNQVQPSAVTAAYGLVAGISQVNLPIPKANYSQTPTYATVNSARAQIYIGK